MLTTNSPLTVAEGATGAINAARLTTTDVDNTPAQLVYTITSGPTRGTVKRSGSATNSFTQADINAGLITYQHDGSETTSDSFAFTVDDGQGSSTSATFNIVVTPVNDEQVLTTNSPLTVAEGATGAISAARLTTTDVDNTPAQLVYTITSGPTHGTVKRSGSATNSFTQADINAGLITYQHNGSETTSDSFAFTVNDGQGTSTSATFNIVVTPVNDEQVLTTNSPLTVAEGATGAISAARLTTTDVDNTPAQLVYTITSGPTNGTLKRSGSATNSFTQADINAGLVTYQHDGSETTSDSFAFTVDDGQGTSTSATFNIVVTPVNDNIPVFTSPDTVSVVENTLAVTTVTAADSDLPTQSISFSIVGGADQNMFSITSGGVLTFNSAPNFGTPADANGDNIYLLTVQASDGAGGTAVQNMSVAVTAANVTYIDQAWLNAHGDGPYYLDQQGKTYVLQTDVTTDGTAFAIVASDVTFDLNGHTITYDNAAPITIPEWQLRGGYWHGGQRLGLQHGRRRIALSGCLAAQRSL